MILQQTSVNVTSFFWAPEDHNDIALRYHAIFTNTPIVECQNISKPIPEMAGRQLL